MYECKMELTHSLTFFLSYSVEPSTGPRTYNLRRNRHPPKEHDVYVDSQRFIEDPESDKRRKRRRISATSSSMNHHYSGHSSNRITNDDSSDKKSSGGREWKTTKRRDRGNKSSNEVSNDVSEEGDSSRSSVEESADERQRWKKKNSDENPPRRSKRLMSGNDHSQSESGLRRSVRNLGKDRPQYCDESGSGENSAAEESSSAEVYRNSESADRTEEEDEDEDGEEDDEDESSYQPTGRGRRNSVSRSKGGKRAKKTYQSRKASLKRTKDMIMRVTRLGGSPRKSRIRGRNNGGRKTAKNSHRWVETDSDSDGSGDHSLNSDHPSSDDVEMRTSPEDSERGIRKHTYTEWVSSISGGTEIMYAVRRGTFKPAVVTQLTRHLSLQEVSEDVEKSLVSHSDAASAAESAILDESVKQVTDVDMKSSETMTLKCSKTNPDEWDMFDDFDDQTIASDNHYYRYSGQHWWQRCRIGDIIVRRLPRNEDELIPPNDQAQTKQPSQSETQSESHSNTGIDDDSEMMNKEPPLKLPSLDAPSVCSDKATGESRLDPLKWKIKRFRVSDAWFSVSVTVQTRRSEEEIEFTEDGKELLCDRLRPKEVTTDAAMKEYFRETPSPESSPMKDKSDSKGGVSSKKKKKTGVQKKKSSLKNGNSKSTKKGGNRRRTKRRNRFVDTSDDEDDDDGRSSEMSEETEYKGSSAEASSHSRSVQSYSLDISELGHSQVTVPHPETLTAFGSDYAEKVENILYAMSLPSDCYFFTQTFDHLKKKEDVLMSEDQNDIEVILHPMEKKRSDKVENTSVKPVSEEENKKPPSSSTSSSSSSTSVIVLDDTDKENDSSHSNTDPPTASESRRLNSSEPSVVFVNSESSSEKLDQKKTGDTVESSDSVIDLVMDDDNKNGDKNLDTNNTNMSSPKKDPVSSSIMVMKYLCKLVNRSYHECRWLTRREIMKLDCEQKLKNFEQKFHTDGVRTAEQVRVERRIEHAMESGHFDRVHFFSQAYLQIDRIIDVCPVGETYKIVQTARNSFQMLLANHHHRRRRHSDSDDSDSDEDHSDEDDGSSKKSKQKKKKRRSVDDDYYSDEDEMDEDELNAEDELYFAMKQAQGKTQWVKLVNDICDERLYLVKWQSLGYDESTWERESLLKRNVEFISEYDSKKHLKIWRRNNYIPEYHTLNPYPKSGSGGRRSNNSSNLSHYIHSETKLHRMHQRKSSEFRKSFQKVEEGRKFKNGNELRYYQVSGVQWLCHNWCAENPCILADEMGLGKTVQTVTFINECMKQGGFRGPFLIVAPLSTLAHWAREFEAWSDLNAIVYHGSNDARARIRDTEFKWHFISFPSDGSIEAWIKTQKQLKRLNQSKNVRFDVMITTPQMVNCDVKYLKWLLIPWQSIIIDEAHCLKSQKALIYRNLRHYMFFPPLLKKSIQKKQSRSNRYLYQLLYPSNNNNNNNAGSLSIQTHIVLLTGTPIQNNMSELFALLHFMNPKKFINEFEFVNKFENLADKQTRDELKSLLKGCLLQRYKSLVEKKLQNREERIIWVELTKFQKKWYKALYERSYDTLRKIGGVKSSLMNVAMQLRKCCNHPFLIRDVEDSISNSHTQSITYETIMDNLIKASGKLVLLDKLLPKMKKDGHRLLIFSQMSRMLDILEDYLTYRKVEYERLDGSVTGIERQMAIDRYTNDDGILVFLLTTRAGGVGINLMAADTVVIYDSDWNPMNDIQAIARAHRIGQKRKVSVYRLVTRNSYEESMFRKADQKMALNKVVMGDMSEMTKSDVSDLLKKGAISVFLKDKETDQQIEQFAQQSIDEILQTRTEQVQTEEDEQGRAVALTLGGNNSNSNSGSSSVNLTGEEGAMFSEAVFVAAAEDTEVDIHANDFWDHIGLEDPRNAAVDMDDEVEMYARGRGKYRMRRRKKKVLKKHGGKGDRGSDYDDSSDDIDDDDDEEDTLNINADDRSDDSDYTDEGEPLLGALLKRLWGQWWDIFSLMSVSEKEKCHLPFFDGVIDDDEDEEDEDEGYSDDRSRKRGNPNTQGNEAQPMDVDGTAAVDSALISGPDSKTNPTVGSASASPGPSQSLIKRRQKEGFQYDSQLSDWILQPSTLRLMNDAAVQTIALLFQLTKPELRQTFVRNKECFFLDPYLRTCIVHLLTRQICGDPSNLAGTFSSSSNAPKSNNLSDSQPSHPSEQSDDVIIVDKDSDSPSSKSKSNPAGNTANALLSSSSKLTAQQMMLKKIEDARKHESDVGGQLCRLPGCTRLVAYREDNDDSSKMIGDHRLSEYCCVGCADPESKTHSVVCERSHHTRLLMKMDDEFEEYIQFKDHCLKSLSSSKKTSDIATVTTASSSLSSSMKSEGMIAQLPPSSSLSKENDNDNDNDDANHQRRKQDEIITEKQSFFNNDLHRLGTDTLLMCVACDLIEKQQLKDMIKNKQIIGGDVSKIVAQLERVFVIRGLVVTLCGMPFSNLAAYPMEKMLSPSMSVLIQRIKALSVYAGKMSKGSKQMPNWWKPELDAVLIAGTFVYGWGMVPESFAKLHGFSGFVLRTSQENGQSDKNARVELVTKEGRPLTGHSHSSSSSLSSSVAASAAATVTVAAAAADSVSQPASASASAAVDTSVQSLSESVGKVNIGGGEPSEDFKKAETKRVQWISEKKQIARLNSLVGYLRMDVKRRHKETLRIMQNNALIESNNRKEKVLALHSKQTSKKNSSSVNRHTTHESSKGMANMLDHHHHLSHGMNDKVSGLGGTDAMPICIDDDPSSTSMSPQIPDALSQSKHEKKKKRKKRKHESDEQKLERKRKRRERKKQNKGMSDLADALISHSTSNGSGGGGGKKQTKLNFKPINRSSNGNSSNSSSNMMMITSSSTMMKKSPKRTQAEIAGYFATDLVMKSVRFSESVVTNELGQPKLPFSVSKTVQILQLGCIDHRNSKFHNAHYIFPVGYTVKVSAPHPTEAHSWRDFICRIESKSEGPSSSSLTDSGDVSSLHSTPHFSAHLLDEDGQTETDLRIENKTISGLLTSVYNEGRSDRSKSENSSPSAGSPRRKVQISGYVKFGLRNDDVLKMIECMPNAYKCVDYEFRFRPDLTKKQAKYVRRKQERMTTADPSSSVQIPSETAAHSSVISTSVSRKRSRHESVSTDQPT